MRKLESWAKYLINRDKTTRIIVCVSRLFDGLTEPFLAHRREDVAFLRVLLRHKKFNEIRELGHEIKGTASVYGFPGMAEIGLSIEEAASQRKPQILADLAAELGEYLNRVEVVFK